MSNLLPHSASPSQVEECGRVDSEVYVCHVLETGCCPVLVGKDDKPWKMESMNIRGLIQT